MTATAAEIRYHMVKLGKHMQSAPHRAALLPVFRRLKKELENAEARENAMDEISSFLAQHEAKDGNTGTGRGAG